MQQKHLEFSTEPVSRASAVFRKGAELRNEKMSGYSLDEQRAAHEKLWTAPRSPGVVEVLPASCAVPCEWVLRPENYSEKIIVYLHGGGWTLGNASCSRPVAALLAEVTPYKVLAVDYRLAPEHPYPAALDDCHEVYGWLLDNGYRAENIALFGDSAGGNLALCLMHRLLREGLPLPCAIGGASPVTDMSGTAALVRAMPPLTTVMVDGESRDVFSLYAPGQDRESELLSPVMGDLSRFPPTLIHVGGAEDLALDCAAFAKKAVAQGAWAHTKVWREMHHDFSIVGVALRESRQSMKEFAEFFVEHLGHGASRRLLERK